MLLSSYLRTYLSCRPFNKRQHVILFLPFPSTFLEFHIGTFFSSEAIHVKLLEACVSGNTIIDLFMGESVA